MNSLVTRILGMLIRVRQFGIAHASHFAAGSRGQILFDFLGQTIVNLENHSTTQAQHRRATKQQTRQKLSAIKALREMMADIARTARSMSRSIPGLQDKFRMPTGESEQNLLTAARAFAADAEPIKDEFISRGMAATFLEDFRALIEEVKASIDAQAQKSSASISATAAVSDTAQAGRDAVRELNAIVRNIFKDNPAVLAEWESASHVERSSRRAAKKEPAGEPEPAKG